MCDPGGLMMMVVMMIRGIMMHMIMDFWVDMYHRTGIKIIL